MSLLQISNLDVFYGESQALWDICLEVEKGQLVTLVGANGTGKTTLLKSINGLLSPRSGKIFFSGEEMQLLPVHEVSDRGITLVPEGRQLFPKMNVEDNLIAGSYLKRAKKKRSVNLSKVYELFPRLQDRKKQIADTLSGGEQQMLAIGRALMQDPQLIMFDEPSLGLAPILVQEIFSIIDGLHNAGATILLVEQNVNQALKVADFCYVMENGRIVMQGTGQELENDEKIREAYMGL
ncbi:MAG: ABC transporter ATP-binding protein [Syntrophobacteraceae bacterium]